jgi:hypothetical protein
VPETSSLGEAAELATMGMTTGAPVVNDGLEGILQKWPGKLTGEPPRRTTYPPVPEAIL